MIMPKVVGVCGEVISKIVVGRGVGSVTHCN